jgi:hypothetical protein
MFNRETRETREKRFLTTDPPSLHFRLHLAFRQASALVTLRRDETAHKKVRGAPGFPVLTFCGSKQSLDTV